MFFPRPHSFSGLSLKIYVAFLVTTIIPTVVASAIGAYFSLQALQHETLRNLNQEVTVRSQGLGRFFDQLSAQVLSMASMGAIRQFAAAKEADDLARIEAAGSWLERDYAALARFSKYVYQIRLIGMDGQEWIRVDRRSGDVVVASPQDLQFKGDRYYFLEASALQPGQLYVSPLDLNVEFGIVEQPERPVIRVGTPVAGRDGSKLGVLIINLHADLLLEQVQQMADLHKGNAYLLDDSGQYLSRSAGGEHARFAMQPVDKLMTLMPESIGANLIKGELSPNRDDGWIMAQASIDFSRQELPASAQGKWRIALAFPERELFFAVFNLYIVYGALLVALLMSAIAGYLLSRRLLRPISDMSAETTAIANGDFTRRVSVSGNDEITALAKKFNLMAERLQASASEVNAHREQLEQQVRDRTLDLEQERAALEAVIEHTADGILEVSKNGKLRLVNAAGMRLIGNEHALGAPLGDFWPQWSQIVRDAAGSALRCDLHVRELILSLTVAPTAAGYIVVARDVSQERRFLDERRMLDRQMFQMEKLTTLGELAMGLAHEIGNPLAGMKAVVQAMQYEDEVPEGLIEPLTRLESEIDRLSGFLRSFHGYAAPQRLQVEACRLDDVLDDVLFWTGKDARSKRVTVELHGTATLPPLWADPNQFKQTLLNLVINAVHAMPKGGNLTVAARVDGHRALIEVRDTGIGIAPEVLSQIFDPFFTTRSEGTGLGLAIVRKIAEQHGARIEVRSDSGHGTCFTLDWPLFGNHHV